MAMASEGEGCYREAAVRICLTPGKRATVAAPIIILSEAKACPEERERRRDRYPARQL